MFLITIQQQFENRDPLLSEIPERKFQIADMRALGDWCHAFMRACANAGWLRQPEDRMLSFFLSPNAVEFRKHNLAPQMFLKREGKPYVISISIEFLVGAPSPSVTAAAFVR